MHESVASLLLATTSAVCMGLLPNIARCDWNVGTDVAWRHDDNVGDAHNPADRVAAFITSAKLSAVDLVPFDAGGMTVLAGAELAGESYDHIHGLSNASLGGTLALRKKWGQGAYVPWSRIAVSIARDDCDLSNRNATVYRAVLSGGRRLDERWNVILDYAFERRSATPQTPDSPKFSGDVFSQSSHTVGLTGQYAWSELVHLTAGLVYRHGDVDSTTQNDAAFALTAHAIAQDPAFGPDAYVYKLTASTYGAKMAIDYALAAHHSVGLGFARYETRADGGVTYTKSTPFIRWDYVF